MEAQVGGRIIVEGSKVGAAGTGRSRRSSMRPGPGTTGSGEATATSIFFPSSDARVVMEKPQPKKAAAPTKKAAGAAKKAKNSGPPPTTEATPAKKAAAAKGTAKKA